MATPSKTTAAGTRDDPELTKGPAADDLKTEKEKGGKDPVGAAKSGEKSEILDIQPSEPYPHGSPPDAEEQFKAAHGFKRAKE